ncbi:MAG TPA: hypothetical protein ENH82_06160 [bacterium]|nr:hypothetical protein [bacterium]
MNTVKVEKDRLLKKLIVNRDSHRAEFLKAQKGFREEVIEQLDEALQDARNGKRINTCFKLPAPVDQTSDYDTAIEMLDWVVDDEIELTQQAFRQYILDDWHWKTDWTVSNSAYMAR